MPLRYAVLYRLIGLLLLVGPSAFAQTGIGTSNPNPKAVLDLSSTDKGLLLPRLTAAQRQAISAPPLGLTVFQTGTDSVGYWYYSGVRWTWLSAQQADNLGNHTATRNLDLGYNLLTGGGMLGLRVTYNALVGIGTSNPVSRLSLGNGAGVIEPGNSSLTRIANYEDSNGQSFYGTGLVLGGSGYGLGLWGGTGGSLPWNGSTGTLPHLFMLSGGGVGIGTLTPHPSAVLDLSSTSKGLLVPRMTQLQRDAIASSSAGLVVFNTYSQRASLFTGTAWADLLTATEDPERSVGFSYTGGAQQWTVPPGVTSIRVTAAAGSGGASRAASWGSPGGGGGVVSATLPVTPGEVLTIQVGGAGVASNLYTQVPGGYNGGGRGYHYGGSGGGATDIRRGGATLTDRLVVAGAGGGGTTGLPGGCGGGLVACGGTLAGTQTSGGVAGSCSIGGLTNGRLGLGGDHGTGLFTPGGGGGYYGGAAGCEDRAGGGSSYTLPAATNVVHTQGANVGNGYLLIYYSLPLPAPALSGANFQSIPAGSLTGTVATANLPALTATPSGTQVTLSLGTGNSATFSVADTDNSPTNELQTMTKTGNTVTLSNGGGSFIDTNTDNQNLALSGAALSISGGTGITLPDASATNELQTISKTGSTVTLSSGGGSFTDTDTDNQNLTLTGATLGISGGTGVTLPDASATNELQTLSISGSTISLSSGGAVTVPSSADNLGNHAATQNLALNDHWLSNGGGNNGLRLDATGNVGVGTATPLSRVSLGNGGQSNTASTRIANFESPTGHYFYGTGLVFNTSRYGLGIWGGSDDALPYDGTTSGLTTYPQLFVEDRGYIGIGTIFPDTRLEVMGKTGESYQVARVTSLSDIGSGIGFRSMAADGRSYTLLTTGQSGGSGAGAFGLYDEGSTGGTAGYRWYVKANGFMGIGTTAPARRLDVAGDAVVRGTLEVTGNVSFCGGAYTCSDRRYKHAITPLQSALANVLNLNGYTYFWRQSEFPAKGFTADRQLGFIAQEIEPLYPEMVLTDPQTGYKSVDYAKLTPVLVEAIKELKGQLDQQAQQAAQAGERAQRAEAAVQSFESRLRALENGGAAARK